MNKSIYIISEGPRGPVKIGIAESIINRMIAIQMCNPRPLRLIAAFVPIDVPARQVEKKIHRSLKTYRILGEWFDLAEETAIKMTREIIGGHNIEAAEVKNLTAENPIFSLADGT